MLRTRKRRDEARVRSRLAWVLAILLDKVDKVFSKDAGDDSSLVHGHSDTIAKSTAGFKLPAIDVSEQVEKGVGEGIATPLPQRMETTSREN